MGGQLRSCVVTIGLLFGAACGESDAGDFAANSRTDALGAAAIEGSVINDEPAATTSTSPVRSTSEQVPTSPPPTTGTTATEADQNSAAAVTEKPRVSVADKPSSGPETVDVDEGTADPDPNEPVEIEDQTDDPQQPEQNSDNDDTELDPVTESAGDGSGDGTGEAKGGDVPDEVSPLSVSISGAVSSVICSTQIYSFTASPSRTIEHLYWDIAAHFEPPNHQTVGRVRFLEPGTASIRVEVFSNGERASASFTVNVADDGAGCDF